ncbi:MAG: helix-turn-helix domain-containing protein [Lachnospiraceae bacterium]
MFDGIPFSILRIPGTMSTREVKEVIASPEDAGRHHHYDEGTVNAIVKNREQIKGLDFSIAGYFQSFSVPPVSEEAKQNLLYLTGFSIQHMDAGSYTRRAYLNEYLLYYTYAGTGELTYQGRTMHLSPGEGFFIDGRTPHAYQSGPDGWVFGLVSLAGRLLPLYYTRFASSGSPVFSDPLEGMTQELLENLLRTYHAGAPFRDFRADAQITLLLTHLLDLSCAGNESTAESIPQKIQYMVQYLESNYRKDISLDFLSYFFGISKGHLSREFKRLTGFSPNEYLIKVRLNHAKDLLPVSQSTIREIAFSCGFRDINNFTNLFKKDTGMTPGAYRKSHLMPGAGQMEKM